MGIAGHVSMVWAMATGTMDGPTIFLYIHELDCGKGFGYFGHPGSGGDHAMLIW